MYFVNNKNEHQIFLNKWINLIKFKLKFRHLHLKKFIDYFITIFVIHRSIGKTQNTRINLGLLSVKGDAPRTANIICVPEHEIWKLKTFDEVKKFLVKSFPQINFSTFVSDEEIARFASSVPGVFPKPQYVKGLQQIFNYKNNGMYVL